MVQNFVDMLKNASKLVRVFESMTGSDQCHMSAQQFRERRRSDMGSKEASPPKCANRVYIALIFAMFPTLEASIYSRGPQSDSQSKSTSFLSPSPATRILFAPSGIASVDRWQGGSPSACLPFAFLFFRTSPSGLISALSVQVFTTLFSTSHVDASVGRSLETSSLKDRTYLAS